MFNSPLIEVAISLVFVYLLASVLTSNLTELLVHLRSKRGKFLRRAIDSVLNDGLLNKNFAYLLYIHPQVDNMRRFQDRSHYRDRSRFPSYIAPEVFAQALIDLIGEEATTTTFEQSPEEPEDKTKKSSELQSTTVEQPAKETGQIRVRENRPPDRLARFRQGVQRLQPSNLTTLLRTFEEQADTPEKLAQVIEAWYEDYMDRVTGWYKSSIFWQLFSVSLLVTVVLNINTVAITKELWHNRAARDQMVQSAEVYVATTRLATPKDSVSFQTRLDSVQRQFARLQTLPVPIGWGKPTTASPGQEGPSGALAYAKAFWSGLVGLRWFGALPGWLMTTLALSFGAPFWFDILRYFVNIRREGIKPQPRLKPPVS